MISNLAWKGGTTSELRGWDHFSSPAPTGLVCVCETRYFICFFFTIVQLEHGDQASSDWPDPTKLGHWKGSGLRTLSHVPASFWIAAFGTVARAVKYRLVRYSGSIYVMFDHDWHTLTWWALRHKATRSSTFLINQKPKQCVCVSPLVGHILSTSLWYSDGSSVFCLQTGPQKGPLAVPTSLLVTSRGTSLWQPR